MVIGGTSSLSLSNAALQGLVFASSGTIAASDLSNFDLGYVSINSVGLMESTTNHLTGHAELFEQPKLLVDGNVVNKALTASCFGQAEETSLIAVGAAVLIFFGVALVAFLRWKRSVTDVSSTQASRPPKDIIREFLSKLRDAGSSETISVQLDSKEQGLEVLRRLNQVQSEKSEKLWHEIAVVVRQSAETTEAFYHLVGNRGQQIEPLPLWTYVARTRHIEPQIKKVLIPIEIFPSVPELLELSTRDVFIDEGIYILTHYGTASAHIENNEFILRFEPAPDTKPDIFPTLVKHRPKFSEVSLDIYYKYSDGRKRRIHTATKTTE